ncbi:Calreticulin-domain-containing protein [Nadsonia fulvescens var. elongata DSM 6958]|uniref:Calreticulin-domain-containing protein n=1 Tax=Nadsonia fulvescens var. elongata DSM 6958 TaxID=857566 RepID=A0A1E3PQ49_9ASCO|nr:Calreticulin-domain-containing protein [Nadsonia fulvescens var. elongata DSM 6958]
MVHFGTKKSVIILTALSLCNAGRFSSNKPIDRPEFTPLVISDSSSSLVFFEDFSNSNGRWKISEHSGDENSARMGKWSIEEPNVFPGFKGDKGLVMKSTSTRHAIWTEFDQPLDNTDNTLVIQYEVKHQRDIKCGGAYIKLLTEGDDLHTGKVSNTTSYQIMFGPDLCGSTDKVHFIINRMNPFNDKYEEKNLIDPPKVVVSKLTTLYTLVIHSNQDYEIRINGKTAKAGSLTAKGTFNPPLNPAAKIPNANERKPKDWDDRRFILDPSLIEKPSDWDEDAPYQIEDPLASKPVDWDENASLFIPDPEAIIPEDWDEEEDGEFLAPEIRNPECQYHGCGPWKPPLIKNPAFDGIWKRPLIDNPNYKGDWKPRMITNPNYYEDISPSNLEPIGGIGFDLWTIENNVLFDNIYVGHSVEQAENIGNKSFIPKFKLEREMEVRENSNGVVEPIDPRKLRSTKPPNVIDLFLADPFNYIFSRYKNFLFDFLKDPLEAFMTEPALAVALTTFCFVFSVITFALLNIFVYSIRINLGMKPVYDSKSQSQNENISNIPKDTKPVSGVPTKVSSAIENPSHATKRTAKGTDSA